MIGVQELRTILESTNVIISTITLFISAINDHRYGNRNNDPKTIIFLLQALERFLLPWAHDHQHNRNQTSQNYIE